MSDKKETAFVETLKRLWGMDLSLILRMAGGLLPNVLDNMLADLSEEQKKAIDKVLPPGGEKKIYIQLVGNPTQPIVIGMARPISITTMSEADIEKQQIKGIKIKLDDIMPLAEGRTIGNMLKVVWMLKGQMGTVMSIAWSFRPILVLGRSGIDDMKNRMTSKMQPLLKLINS